MKDGILAVDFGLQRTGLAVCDSNRRVAVGAGNLSDLKNRALARSIIQAAESRGIKTILVGEPPPDAREVEAVIDGANNLCVRLEQHGFNVIRWDEDCTTAEALAARKHIGGKSSKGKKWIDEASAIILLQRYLDYLNNLSN